MVHILLISSYQESNLINNSTVELTWITVGLLNKLSKTINAYISKILLVNVGFENILHQTASLKWQEVW